MESTSPVHEQPAQATGRPWTTWFRRLSTLDKLTVASLVAMSPLLVFGMMFVGGRIDRVALTCGAAALLAAALVVATGRRWSPLLAAVPGALTFAVAGRFILQSLLEPWEALNFGFWMFLMAIMGVATVASVIGTAQHYLHPAQRGAPRWIAALLAAIGAAAIGAIMVAALPQQERGIAVDPQTLARLPALATEDYKFTSQEIRVKAGQRVALRLDNADDGPHSFDIDELNVHTPMASKSTSLAIFDAGKPGTYVFYCAVGQHRQGGMVGTLIVEP